METDRLHSNTNKSTNNNISNDILKVIKLPDKYLHRNSWHLKPSEIVLYSITVCLNPPHGIHDRLKFTSHNFIGKKD